MATRRVYALLWLALVLFVSGCGDVARKGSEDKEAELRLARAAADGFLQAVERNDPEAMFNHLSKDYQARLGTEKKARSLFPFLQHAQGWKLDIKSWKITSTEMSSNQTSVEFKGAIRADYRSQLDVVQSTDANLEFNLLAVKEKDSGSWRVASFSRTDGN